MCTVYSNSRACTPSVYDLPCFMLNKVLGALSTKRLLNSNAEVAGVLAVGYSSLPDLRGSSFSMHFPHNMWHNVCECTLNEPLARLHSEGYGTLLCKCFTVADKLVEQLLQNKSRFNYLTTRFLWCPSLPLSVIIPCAVRWAERDTNEFNATLTLFLMIFMEICVQRLLCVNQVNKPN